MNVVYMMGSLNRGGSETLMLDILRNTKNGEINPITIHRKKGDLYTQFLDTKFPILELKPRSILDFGYLFKLRKIFSNHSIEIVHANQFIDALFALLARNKKQTRVVLTLHGHYYRMGRIRKIIFKKYLRNLDALIFVSNAQYEDYLNRKLIQKTSRINHHVIHNAIDLNRFNFEFHQHLRKELNIDDNQLLIGTVGNFGPGRDQMTICKFLKKLNDENLDFTFCFVGARNTIEGWRYDNCVDFIEDEKLDHKVFFLGKREEVPELMNQLDAFIYSSEHDTFGLVVIEAIAAGVPVFVNDIPVMKEVVDNGRLGILYKSKNSIDLFEKFLNEIKKKRYKNSKKKDIPTSFINRYGIENYMFSLCRLYKKVKSE